MDSTKAIKWLGLLGSIAIGGKFIAMGDYMQGFGIITASLSSAGVIKPQVQN